ncbi:hypothetical protein [Nocardia arizonensis]|nr:hypothetical protein [Nocardia arizonensis]
MSMSNLGSADFQLHLLKTMDAPESLLTAALNDLGSSKEDMLARSADVHRALWIGEGGSASNILPILDRVRVPSQRGEGSFAFSLSVWKGYLYIVSFDPTGDMFDTIEFIRRDDRSSDPILNPWEILEGELPELFDRIEEFESWGPSYKVVTARHVASGEPFRLRFAYGLLQASAPGENISA